MGPEGIKPLRCSICDARKKRSGFDRMCYCRGTPRLLPPAFHEVGIGKKNSPEDVL
jgi:hypothetical protein